MDVYGKCITVNVGKKDLKIFYALKGYDRYSQNRRNL